MINPRPRQGQPVSHGEKKIGDCLFWFAQVEQFREFVGRMLPLRDGVVWEVFARKVLMHVC